MENYIQIDEVLAEEVGNCFFKASIGLAHQYFTGMTTKTGASKGQFRRKRGRFNSHSKTGRMI